MRRKRRQYYKAEARRLLDRQNLYVLIMAALLLVMMSIAWQVIVSGFFSFFHFETGSLTPENEQIVMAAETTVNLLGVLILLMPLWYGFCAIARTMVFAQEDATPAEPGQLFCAFSSPRILLRVWRASLWIFWRFAFSAGLIWGMWYGVGLLEPHLPGLAYFALCTAAVVLTPLLLFPLAGTHLIFPLLLDNPTLGIFSAVWRSMRLSWRALGETLLFWMSFLPWFALGFATGGVMLVLYVLPYFILADTLYAGFLLARGR